MTRVLVAGASGMLGHTLVPTLQSAGFEVVSHGHTGPTDVSADLTDHDAAQGMLDRVRPDAIVNLVALTDVDRCQDEVIEAYRLNVRPVEILSDWIGRDGRCRLIQISTDQVYDGTGPHREPDVTVPNVYALSKYAGELAALRCGATVLRTNFFGPSRMAHRQSFSDWIAAKFRAREPFIGFDDVLFSPLSMSTLSQMIARVIKLPKPGVFNLGSRDGMSKAGFADALARHLGLDSSPMRRGVSADVKLKAYRPFDMRMDPQLFEMVFRVTLPDLADEIERVET